MDPYSLDRFGLTALLADLDPPQPRYRAEQVQRWLARGVDDPADMTDLPKRLRAQLRDLFDPPPRVLRVSTADEGLTRKVLLEVSVNDRREGVESVLMLYPSGDADGSGRASARATVCISTQAGCAMGCPFCATGQAGYRGQLGVGAIVRQVTVMQAMLAGGGDAVPPGTPRQVGGPVPPGTPRQVGGPGPPGTPRQVGGPVPPGTPRQVGGPVPPGTPRHVTNVVFMGMGEPLANLEPTLAAVRWLHDPEAFGLSARSITVSTVGLVPGIRRLARLALPITLAVSLHAATDELRDDLVPVNRQWPLATLLEACGEYRAATGRRVSFEYILIDGINVGREHAEQLADLVSGFLASDPSGGTPDAAHVNLIPMNPTPAVPWTAPPRRRQQAFADVLARAGVPVTLRRNRGGDIEAACGQLYADYAMASGKTLPAALGAVERLAPASLAAGSPRPAPGPAG